MESVFQALSSMARRKILAYLSKGELTAGEIADRFDMSKPSISKHLSILENAGLIEGNKQGQYIHYRLVSDNLTNTLHGFMQEVCPHARPLRKESKAIAEAKAKAKTEGSKTNR